MLSVTPRISSALELRGTLLVLSFPHHLRWKELFVHLLGPCKNENSRIREKD